MAKLRYRRSLEHQMQLTTVMNTPDLQHGFYVDSFPNIPLQQRRTAGLEQG